MSDHSTPKAHNVSTQDLFEGYFDQRKYLETYYPHITDVDTLVKVVDNIHKAGEPQKLLIDEIAQNERVPHEMVENAFIADFHRHVLIELLRHVPDDGATVLDVAGGATIYQHLITSLFAKSIIHSEYSTDGRNQVASWINDASTAYDWDGYFYLLRSILKRDRKIQAECQKDTKIAKTVRQVLESTDIKIFKKVVRQKLKGNVVYGDVFQPNLGLESGQKEFDVVSAHFSVESATGLRPMWELGMQNIINAISPSGFLILTAIQDAEWYYVHTHKIPAVKVTLADIEQLCRQNDLKILRKTELVGSDREKHGYSGMVMILAQKIPGSGMEIIHNAVLEYCDQQGLLQKVIQRAQEREHHRFTERNIDDEGLHLLDAVHCVHDTPRTTAFLKEINKYVHQQSVVIEAGLGTGVLAFFAAAKSARVYGLEINRQILNLAKNILSHLKKKALLNQGPTLLLGDATKMSLPEQADVVINENIYTGMFFEKQVQIMNNMRNFIKPDGITIPMMINMHAALCDVTYPHQPLHREMFVPEYEKNLRVQEISEQAQYATLDFRGVVDEKINAALTCTIVKKGMCNGFLIYSEVIMPSGAVIGRNETTFLNNDIVLAVQPPIPVDKGDKVLVTLSYNCGESPMDATLKVQKIEL